MRKIDLIRTKIGLENYRWLRINAQGHNVVEALHASKAIETHDPRIVFEKIAKPTAKILRQFKPREAESKQRNPKRPLPVRGEFNGYALTIPAEKRRIFLPVLIAGAREDGSYIKIKVEANADVDLFLVTAETEEPIYIDIDQGENSQLHFTVIKHPGFASWQMLSYRVKVGAHASFNVQTLNLESSAYDVGQVVLAGEGASADTNSAIFVDAWDEIRIDTTIEHRAPNTTSNIFNHGVVRAEGYGMFAGRSFIEKGATGSFGDQESRFLMLDPSARADSYPVLLIDENELKAGHAASIGQLDEESLYYLQSRGMTRVQAEQLVTSGYLQPVIDMMMRTPDSPAAGAVSYLRNVLLEKVGQ